MLIVELLTHADIYSELWSAHNYRPLPLYFYIYNYRHMSLSSAFTVHRRFRFACQIR